MLRVDRWVTRLWR